MDIRTRIRKREAFHVLRPLSVIYRFKSLSPEVREGVSGRGGSKGIHVPIILGEQVHQYDDDG